MRYGTAFFALLLYVYRLKITKALLSYQYFLPSFTHGSYKHTIYFN